MNVHRGVKDERFGVDKGRGGDWGGVLMLNGRGQRTLSGLE